MRYFINENLIRKSTSKPIWTTIGEATAFARCDQNDRKAVHAFWSEYEDLTNTSNLINPVDTDFIESIPYKTDKQHCFLQAPYEVLPFILRKLRIADLRNFALLCKYFHGILKKHVQVCFDVEKRQRKLLQEVLNGNDCIREYFCVNSFTSITSMSFSLAKCFSSMCSGDPNRLVEALLQALAFDGNSFLNLSVHMIELDILRGRSKDYALWRIKDELIDKIMDSGKTNFDIFFKDSMRMLDRHPAIFNDIADALISQEHIDANAICNFMKELKMSCYKYIYPNKYIPLYPKIFVLIDRLARKAPELALKELSGWLIVSESNFLHISNALALACGIYGTDQISMAMREAYIFKSIGARVSLKDKHLFSELAKHIGAMTDMNRIKIGSTCFPNFPPAEFLHMLVRECNERGLEDYQSMIDITPTVGMLEEFFAESGVFYTVPSMYSILKANLSRCERLVLRKWILMWSHEHIEIKIDDLENDLIKDLIKTILD